MNRKILRLALPNILSNISIPLLSMVDLAIVGRLGNESYIGALAVAGVIFNLVYWNFGFLRMGTTGFTAQSFGSRNLRECVDILQRALLIGLIVAVLIIALQRPIALLAFLLIEAGDTTKELALQYFYIRIWAAPCNLLLYGFNGWFFGMQNARFPMYITILINVLNILFSLFFVFYLQMDIRGVAYGTLCAQYCGLLMAIILWFRFYGKLAKYFSLQRIFIKGKLIQFFKVNVDIFLRSLCLIVVFSSFTIFSSQFGDTILAVNTLLIQFFYLFSYIMDGFAFAAESLVGKYIGAKNKNLLISTIRHIFKWGWILTGIGTIIYLIFDVGILRLLTTNQEIIAACKPYMIWIYFVPIFGFAAFLWDGIYVGATASKAMRNAIFIATAAYFFVNFTLQQFMGNGALWLSLLLFLLLRGIGMKFFAPKAILKKIEDKE